MRVAFHTFHIHTQRDTLKFHPSVYGRVTVRVPPTSSSRVQVQWTSTRYLHLCRRPSRGSSNRSSTSSRNSSRNSSPPTHSKVPSSLCWRFSRQCKGSKRRTRAQAQVQPLLLNVFTFLPSDVATRMPLQRFIPYAFLAFHRLRKPGRHSTLRIRSLLVVVRPFTTPYKWV